MRNLIKELFTEVRAECRETPRLGAGWKCQRSSRVPRQVGEAGPGKEPSVGVTVLFPVLLVVPAREPSQKPEGCGGAGFGSGWNSQVRVDGDQGRAAPRDEFAQGERKSSD